jgi:hypothetical protein
MTFIMFCSMILSYKTRLPSAQMQLEKPARGQVSGRATNRIWVSLSSCCSPVHDSRVCEDFGCCVWRTWEPHGLITASSLLWFFTRFLSSSSTCISFTTHSRFPLHTLGEVPITPQLERDTLLVYCLPAISLLFIYYCYSWRRPAFIEHLLF